MGLKNRPNPRAAGRRKTLPARPRSHRGHREPSSSPAKPSSPERKSSLIVGLGASAGGLRPLQDFFGAMPPETGAAFLVVQHLDPTRHSETSALLGRHTSMSVVEATHGMRIQPNHVYTIPPGRYLTVEDGALRVTPVETRGLRLPVDALFQSLALEVDERAVGIVLSGTGSDGSQGLRSINANGGMAIVQDPGTAEYDGMPRSAIATGIVDYIVPVPQMPQVILGYAGHPYVRGPIELAGGAKLPQYVSSILGLLHARRNVDFNGYKRGTLLRRIGRRMSLRQKERGSDYLDLLREEEEEVRALFNDLLIQVTRFFREPEAWGFLEQEIIPRLIEDADKDNPVRVWVPGCATGEEAYSLAILFLERVQQAQKNAAIQVFASDLDRASLDIARAGSYPDSIAADVSHERLRRFFTQGEHRYTVNQQVRDTVIFAQQNVLADPPFSRLDLVSCRNLLIYLESAAQRRVLEAFDFALKPGRFLFLGSTESAGPETELFELVSKKARVYRKVGTVTRDRPRVLLVPAVPPGEIPVPSRPPPVPRDSIAVSLARDVVLERYAGASVVVNQKFEILALFGPTQRYLTQPAGAITADLLAWVGEGARTKVRIALHTALRKNELVTVPRLRIKRNGGYHRATCVVEPLHSIAQTDALLLVVFRDEAAPVSDDPGPATDEPLVRQLEYELRVARDELQSSVEQVESANEELRATNEEILSINEELQSANEELETSKEELQSMNEELTTVNSQLEAKVVELQELNDDVNNLLVSTDIPTLFLDRALHIRRFTPSTTRLFHLIKTDIGRPLGDISPVVNDPGLLVDAGGVLEHLITTERQVGSQGGGVYLRRITPYRTLDHRIDGVVVTYIDITDRARAEDRSEHARRYAEMIVETVREPLVVLDPDLVIQSANAAFYRVFRLSPPHTVGRRIFDMGGGEWDIPDLRKLLEEILPTSSQISDFEVRRTLPGLGQRVMWLNARASPALPGMPPLILLAIEDVTVRMQAEETRNEVLRQMVTYEERERHRLALELHDETGQHVTAFLLGLAALKQRHAEEPEALEVIGQLEMRAVELAKQLHGVALQLRPSALDDLGLDQALRDYAETVLRSSDMEVDLVTTGAGLGRVPPPVETLLYRVAQEAVTNVLKHAKAKKLSVVLDRRRDEISLVIEDDGIGFDPNEARRLTPGSGRLGLAGMRERVALAGGSLTIESSPNEEGTTVIVRVPVPSS